MSQGLQVWGADGVIVFDTNTRAGILIGEITTGTTNGSITDYRLSMGSGFCMVMNGSFSFSSAIPVARISGSTLTWEFPPEGARQDSVILYGVF